MTNFDLQTWKNIPLSEYEPMRVRKVTLMIFPILLSLAVLTKVQAEDSPLSEADYLSVVACGDDIEVAELVELTNRFDYADFQRRRENVRSFLRRSHEEIKLALESGDHLQAGLLCAWADDLTLGFTAPCPDDQVADADLVSLETMVLCRQMAR